MQWDALLGDCEATTDWPAALFYEELMNAYPEAKVVLTIRDPDKWWKSYKETVLDLTLVKNWRDCFRVFLETFGPRFRMSYTRNKIKYQLIYATLQALSSVSETHSTKPSAKAKTPSSASSKNISNTTSASNKSSLPNVSSSGAPRTAGSPSANSWISPSPPNLSLT